MTNTFQSCTKLGIVKIWTGYVTQGLQDLCDIVFYCPAYVNELFIDYLYSYILVECLEKMQGRSVYYFVFSYTSNYG